MAEYAGAFAVGALGNTVGFPGRETLSRWANDMRYAGDRWDKAQHQVRRADYVTSEVYQRIRDHPSQFTVGQAFRYGYHTGRVHHALDTANVRVRIRESSRPSGLRDKWRFQTAETGRAQRDIEREIVYLDGAMNRQERNVSARYREVGYDDPYERQPVYRKEVRYIGCQPDY